MKNLIKLFLFSLRIIPLSFFSLIPKNKKVWVFGAWFGQKFSDNPKYFYLYVKEKHPTIRVIWICKNKRLLNSLKKEKHVEAYYALSFKGIYYQLISGIVFFSHSISSDFCPLFISFSTVRFQMWHGIPLKKIAYDDEFHTRWWKRNSLYKLLVNERYDFVLSTGEKVSKIFSSAFDIELSKCVPLGYPRNDVFLNDKLVDKQRRVFNVIYMPTFRNDYDGEVSFLNEDTGFDYDKLSSLLENRGVHLTLRLHPANRPSKELIEKIENSSWISFSTDDDVYRTINQYDCLLTDYSSIMFDFAISGKPILFFPFDIKEYLNTNRDMYHEYFELANKKNILYSWNGVIERVLEIKDVSPSHFANNQILMDFHDLTGLKNIESPFSDALFKYIINITLK